MTTKTTTIEEAEVLLRQEAQKRGMEYEWSYTEEPHATRRKAILAAHPEIQQLFGHNPTAKYYAAATVALQTAVAFYAAQPTTSWLSFFLLAYFVGGTCVHSLTLAIHEMSHNLFFKTTDANKLYSMFCNWPLIVPYSASFKKYHLDHHKFQGVDGVDTDIPTSIEAKFFTTPFRKFLWVLFQPAFYAIRPLIICPKPLNTWDYLNIVTQALYIFVMYRLAGIASIGYMAASTFLGLGIHFCAGHFISEHYTTLAEGGAKGPHESSWSPAKKGDETLYVDETFSYRGPLNMFSYNVGYHVAHHDFPFVSGFRLPELEKMAPEFYEHLPVTKSWPGTTLAYIFSKANPFNRVKRHRQSAVEVKKTK